MLFIVMLLTCEDNARVILKTIAICYMTANLLTYTVVGKV